MAVDAAVDCLGNIDRQSIDGLYFASTSAPYTEKQSAALIACALDLRRDALTIDFANSLRSGTMALTAALDAVAAGSAKMVLVIAADCRVGIPYSALETITGDGAAALLVGDADVAADIQGRYSVNDEFTGIWKRQNDAFVRSWEDRFIISKGYEPVLEEAVSGLLKKYDLTIKDFTKAAFYAPTLRAHATMAKSLKLDPKIQVQEPLFTTAGNTGAALALMMLVGALEEVRPGDRVLLANYGDGADAFVLQATDQIEGLRGKRAIKGHLASKMPLVNYERYLAFREIIPMEAPARPPNQSSAALVSRPDERDRLLRFLGSKCQRCGTILYPPPQVCMNCGARGEFDSVRLSDKRGKIFSFSADLLAGTLDPPLVVVIIDFDDGGRAELLLTDRDPATVKIGMPVELTFRKFHEAAGFHNYYWKARPPRLG
jgi:3-hydroxy-3-methylglutaryl CoA synthase